MFLIIYKNSILSIMRNKNIYFNPLKRQTRLAQERQLLRAGGATQNRIAVRVAAKVPDDGLVAQLKVQIVSQLRLRKQRNRLPVQPPLRRSSWVVI